MTHLAIWLAAGYGNQLSFDASRLIAMSPNTLLSLRDVAFVKGRIISEFLRMD